MNESLNSIFNRTSIRHYTPAEVGMETLTLLAKSGMAAPSANNKQPWYIIAVTDRHLLQELADQLPYCKMAREAAAAMVVCGNMETDPIGNEKGYWALDCSAVAENILIAATSLGLGSVWTAVHPQADRIACVKKILNLPDHLIALAVIPVGHTEGISKPKDKWDENKFRLNAFPANEK